ncbi:ATP-binding cassette domain-containing protein [Moorella naiadis]|uniref:ATP-binding cassette domain-containing protein n=1 Tax=Moorella naiadis (nom. illeg.) TaxID=3093670 RepID=UPI003D9C9ED6
MSENVIEIRDLSKYYPGTTALDGVSFDIKRNTVHCIVGENGAGKSTFVGILSGAIKRSKGKIIYNNTDYNPQNIRDAINSGMSFLFQELNVVETLTVEQNLTLGIEKKKYGFIRRSKEADKSFEVLRSFAPDIQLGKRVSELSVAQKQIIEIVKAITLDASVIVMDEPTAALCEEEAKRLFRVINDLTKQNVTVIYISHRLNEIFECGQYVTVLRDGKCVGTKRIVDIASPSELIKMMTGKAVEEGYIPSEIDYNKKVF